MNRAEHLAWAKQRALQYVDLGELADAMSSILSDLAKGEPGWFNIELVAHLGMGELMLGAGASQIRHFIEGIS